MAIKDSYILTKYEVPDSISMPESKSMALELMDEILHKAVGIHLLEPKLEIKTEIRVRPKFPKVQPYADRNSPVYRSLDPAARRSMSSKKLSPIRPK